MSTTTPAPRLGTPDWQRRYPVIIGEGQIIGAVYRWHRDWFFLASTGEKCIGRPEKGRRGVDQAAERLAAEYAAGGLTTMTLAEVTAEAPTLIRPVPLLHTRMPDNRTNRDAAKVAWAGIRLHRWRPYEGFPGSDNPWWQECELCGWQGPRYWSHQRGRNGNPPSTHRHDGGCLGDEKIRELITAYQQ